MRIEGTGNVDTSTRQWAHLDFGSTGTFEMILPEGAAFTSASGVLLTNTGGDPIPEPTTMLLFGTGLAGLVGARIRRERQ